MTQSSHDADKLVTVYVKMRDDLAAKEKDFKEFKKKRQDEMQRIADAIQKIMDDAGGIESLKTKAGTAFRATKDFVSVDDWSSTLEFIVTEALKVARDYPAGQSGVVQAVIDSGALSFFNKAVNKTVVKEYMGEHEGMTPPGLAYGTRMEIQIRRPK